MKKFFLLSILIFSCFFSFGQLSKTHYLPPIAFSSNYYGLNSGPWQGEYIYISTPSTSSVTFNIKEIGGTTIVGEVSNATPYVFTVRTPVTPPFFTGIGGNNNISWALGNNIAKPTKTPYKAPEAPTITEWYELKASVRGRSFKTASLILPGKYPDDKNLLIQIH